MEENDISFLEKNRPAQYFNVYKNIQIATKNCYLLVYIFKINNKNNILVAFIISSVSYNEIIDFTNITIIIIYQQII